ncbi:hypothetical protein [Halovivax cerinus]|uniref:Uncharacterized protein n=1 Tax=Halovivax cerinus TaxID=1487865 RepID=A0ABD5NKE5_9EURY|nr:hypothetical protein [Halovivax cerinus]
MSQSGLSTGSDGEAIHRIASTLDATNVVDVACAVRTCCGSMVRRRYGEEAAATAAVIVASRRSTRAPIDPCSASERLDLEPKAVVRAIVRYETKLSAPASPDERRRLRQTIVAIDELLAALDAGRSNPPRLAGPGFEAVDPRIRALASRPLTDVDADALRRDRTRFESDLALARLGVELFVRLREECSE